VVKLEQNYRSKKEILDLANSVIQRAAHRQAKRLLSQCGLGGLVVHHIAPDPEAESDAIATCMLRRNARESINWSDMAVLVRARADSQLIRAALKRRQIPYQSQFDGQDTLDKVTLMTLHRSKGLEFPIVFLPAMEENTLPHYQAIRSGTASVEEERRLLYVGITRARQELILSSCRNRAGRARTVSRFLTELGMR
jgi:superfamily I DNA/RNA helicase